MKTFRFFLMLVAASVLVLSSGCKRSDNLFADDRSEIIPVMNSEGNAELLNLRTGMLYDFGEMQVKEISLLHEGLMVLRVNEDDGVKYYYANEEGEIVLGPYASASIFNEGKAWVADEKEHLRAIDKEGNTLFTLEQAQLAEAFVDGKALFWTVGDEVGLVNDKGEVLIQPASNVYVCRMGKRMIAGTDSMWVLVNDSHREWVSSQPFGIRGRDMLTVDSTDEFKLNAADNFINSAREYQRFASTNDQMYRNIHTLVGINRRLQELIENGRIIAGRNGSWGVVDTLGKWIVEPEYEEVVPDDGMFMVVLDGKIGWVDMNGKKVIDNLYSQADLFEGSNETHAYRADGMEGMLNVYGQFRPLRKGEKRAMEEYGWQIPLKNRYIYADQMALAIRRGLDGPWIFTGEGYKITDDLIRDYLSLSNFRKASSDYLEISTVVEGLKTLAQGRNSITANEMIDNYYEQELTPARLMALNGKDVKLDQMLISDSLYIMLYAEKIAVTTQVYTGWMERLYDTVFYGSARINRFRFEIQTGGKLAERFEELSKAIEESGDWSVAGKKVVVETDPTALTIVIRINPPAK
ncbi:MAG: WG repeat-containing protein [Paludibacteraceae bacterium]|nr:WG repeat-containing protein [Paludibacteraceae bacterium]